MGSVVGLLRLRLGLLLRSRLLRSVVWLNIGTLFFLTISIQEATSQLAFISRTETVEVSSAASISELLAGVSVGVVEELLAVVLARSGIFSGTTDFLKRR